MIAQTQQFDHDIYSQRFMSSVLPNALLTLKRKTLLPAIGFNFDRRYCEELGKWVTIFLEQKEKAWRNSSEYLEQVRKYKQGIEKQKQNEKLQQKQKRQVRKRFRAIFSNVAFLFNIRPKLYWVFFFFFLESNCLSFFFLQEKTTLIFTPFPDWRSNSVGREFQSRSESRRLDASWLRLHHNWWSYVALWARCGCVGHWFFCRSFVALWFETRFEKKTKKTQTKTETPKEKATKNAIKGIDKSTKWAKTQLFLVFVEKMNRNFRSKTIWPSKLTCSILNSPITVLPFFLVWFCGAVFVFSFFKFNDETNRVSVLGIGVHHSGLHKKYQQTVERYFRSGSRFKNNYFFLKNQIFEIFEKNSTKTKKENSCNATWSETAVCLLVQRRNFFQTGSFVLCSKKKKKKKTEIFVQVKWKLFLRLELSLWVSTCPVRRPCSSATPTFWLLFRCFPQKKKRKKKRRHKFIFWFLDVFLINESLFWSDIPPVVCYLNLLSWMISILTPIFFTVSSNVGSCWPSWIWSHRKCRLFRCAFSPPFSKKISGRFQTHQSFYSQSQVVFSWFFLVFFFFFFFFFFCSKKTSQFCRQNLALFFLCDFFLLRLVHIAAFLFYIFFLVPIIFPNFFGGQIFGVFWKGPTFSFLCGLWTETIFPFLKMQESHRRRFANWRRVPCLFCAVTSPSQPASCCARSCWALVLRPSRR